MLTTLWHLFLSFARTTLIGFGGGPAIIPLYEHEAVEVFKWMTKEEYGQTLAFANALPGPIATKMGIYIGYKVAGWAGAAITMLAVTLPTGIALIALFGVLGKFRDTPFFKGMLAGVRPIVFVMLAMLTAEFARFAFEPFGTSSLRWVPFGLGAVYFISVQYFNLSPIWGVGTALVLGGLLLR